MAVGSIQGKSRFIVEEDELRNSSGRKWNVGIKKEQR